MDNVIGYGDLFCIELFDIWDVLMLLVYIFVVDGDFFL